MKVRASEYIYDSNNVIIYEITNDNGYVHFLHKGYGKESEHLKEKSDDDDLQNHSTIMFYHKEGKSVREIADLVNMSKTTVHRIISQEKSRENFSQDGSVPCEDAGQEGQSGQGYPLLFKSDSEDSFFLEFDESYDAL